MVSSVCALRRCGWSSVRPAACSLRGETKLSLVRAQRHAHRSFVSSSCFAASRHAVWCATHVPNVVLASPWPCAPPLVPLTVDAFAAVLAFQLHGAGTRGLGQRARVWHAQLCPSRCWSDPLLPAHCPRPPVSRTSGEERGLLCCSAAARVCRSPNYNTVPYRVVGLHHIQSPEQGWLLIWLNHADMLAHSLLVSAISNRSTP